MVLGHAFADFVFMEVECAEATLVLQSSSLFVTSSYFFSGQTPCPPVTPLTPQEEGFCAHWLSRLLRLWQGPALRQQVCTVGTKAPWSHPHTRAMPAVSLGRRSAIVSVHRRVSHWALKAGGWKKPFQNRVPPQPLARVLFLALKEK